MSASSSKQRRANTPAAPTTTTTPDEETPLAQRAIVLARTAPRAIVRAAGDLGSSLAAAILKYGPSFVIGTISAIVGIAVVYTLGWAALAVGLFVFPSGGTWAFITALVAFIVIVRLTASVTFAVSRLAAGEKGHAFA